MTDSRTRRLIPVACTLGDAEADQRLDQWHQALRGLVTGTTLPRPGQLRLALADDPARISAVVALAKAEKSCCSFFDFTLQIDADAVTLVIDVPAGSETVLDQVAGLGEPPAR